MVEEGLSVSDDRINTWFRWIAPRRFSLVQQLVIGIALASGAVLARVAIHPILGDTAPYFILIPTLFLTTTIFGGLAGLAFLVAGTALTLAFVIHENTISLTGNGATLATLIFLIVGITLLIFGMAMRGLVLTARSAQARADLLAGEMGHRVKNILALAQVIVRQSASSSADVPQLLATVEERLVALGRAQSIAEVHAGTPPLRDLVSEAVSPFDLARFTITGESVSVDRETAKNLGLLLHELSTNAMKYGALSSPVGKVSISWAFDGEWLLLDWVEKDGPPVRDRGSAGFGSKLARALFVADGGGVSLDFPSSGVRCSVRIPLIRVVIVDSPSLAR